MATRKRLPFFTMMTACVVVPAALICMSSRATPQGGTDISFVDRTAAAGITFEHDNARSSKRYLIETMGAGAAWIDFDNDGKLDLYLVNSAPTDAYQPQQTLRSSLYRNNGNGTFTDVTDRAGVGAKGLFGMGAAVGDYDNDGLPDLYVIGYARSILYHNKGDGSFADVTARSGTANTGRWGSSGAWFDYDHDGRLDLVVANYVDFTPANNLICVQEGRPSYCHPNKYHGQPAALFHNKGDGTFEDVSRASGIGSKAANGLGVVCFDYDGDGWTDVFLANDSMPNHLFRNRGDGTFEEVGLESGVALSDDGKAEAGMGVDAGDYDGDGRPDLFITHLDLELNRLYRNLGNGSFEDATFRSKIGSRNFRLSGFGTRFVDYDNDGWRDLFIVNGHVLDNVALFHTDTTYPENKTVYRNLRGQFEDVTTRLGPALLIPRVGRAAAFADYDNDGDIDVLATNNGQKPQLLQNEGGNRNHWLQVRLTGVRSNRDGIGARVTVKAGGLTQVEEAKGGMSYQSAHDPRLHFGLGAARTASIEVRWPSGAIDRMADVTGDRVVPIREGSSH